jgi:alpha-amylase/alpha-mannosidase (GH57 family)
MRYLCIHGHFYQPPRENPWLEAIELQDSAYPYHDWNERILAECYAPNAAARILDSGQKIARIVNNYASMSFNFGPTLLSWMQQKAPEAYAAVIEADRVSAVRFSGHGSAIAQAYNHMIMPLANERDKNTQVHWGVHDFQTRFGRMPEGMWLAETAVDLASLDALAQAGIQFTVLAPSQAKYPEGDTLDTTQPYWVNLPSGRKIAVFFYDGAVSRAVAFEHLLNDGELFAKRLVDRFTDTDREQLVHIATDGETYGHHHRKGEMALAYGLDYVESRGLAEISNYGEFLERYPPSSEIEIHENTSWSCSHGIGRWATSCGCNSGGGYGSWNQDWRAPLREALDWLRDTVAVCYEQQGRKFLRDPWEARDNYIQVILDRSKESRDAFAAKHFIRRLSVVDKITAWQLLEMQRHAMLMYTSCGWFFDELSGIETVQVIQYAGRVVQIAEEVFGNSLEEAFLERLALAKSNLPEHRNGASIYRKWVKPAVVNFQKLAAHYAISSLFDDYPKRTRIFSYSADLAELQIMESGNMRLAIGKAQFTSEVTQNTAMLTFGALHFGDHNLHAAVRIYGGERQYKSLLKPAKDVVERADIAEAIRWIDRSFGERIYSLKDLFKDEQRKILNQILKATLKDAETVYGQLYRKHAPLLRCLHEIGMPVPPAMKTPAEYALNAMLREAFSEEKIDSGRVRGLLEELRIAGVALDTTTLEYTLRKNLEHKSDFLMAHWDDLTLLQTFRLTVKNALRLPFSLVLWSVQNQCHALLQTRYREMCERAATGEEHAQLWTEQFEQLADLLSLRVPGQA